MFVHFFLRRTKAPHARLLRVIFLTKSLRQQEPSSSGGRALLFFFLMSNSLSEEEYCSKEYLEKTKFSCTKYNSNLIFDGQCHLKFKAIFEFIIVSCLP
jgi:hypothetical protein